MLQSKGRPSKREAAPQAAMRPDTFVRGRFRSITMVQRRHSRRNEGESSVPRPIAAVDFLDPQQLTE